jgi:hypothetical protein
MKEEMFSELLNWEQGRRKPEGPAPNIVFFHLLFQVFECPYIRSKYVLKNLQLLH